MPPADLRRGAFAMVLSSLFFAGMGLMVKVASESLPNTQVVFFRNVLGLLALLPWMLRLGRAGLSTSHLKEHLVRGLAGLGSMYCFFFAIAHMRLAEAVLLNYSIPLFMPFIEEAWLGERFSRRLWGPIAMGFGGLLLILRPGLGVFQPAALAGMASALLAALAQVGVRRLTRTEPTTRIVFYFGAISTVVSALPLAGTWRSPEPTLWTVLLAMGVLATGGQLFLTRAYSGWFYRRWPDRLFLAGATLVCLAGILALRRRAAPVGEGAV
jgi:drug/metabolite transporter (DMT)-like permease